MLFDKKTLRELTESIVDLAKSVRRVVLDTQKPELGTIVIHFHYEGPMPRPVSEPLVLPAQESFSDESQPFSPNPIKDGAVDEAVTVNVVSSDEAQVGIEKVDNNNFKLLTPNETGTAEITVTAPGYRTIKFPFSYKPFVEGQFNPTFGEDTSDTATEE